MMMLCIYENNLNWCCLIMLNFNNTETKENNLAVLHSLSSGAASSGVRGTAGSRTPHTPGY